MTSYTVCSDCGRTYSVTALHLCPTRAEAAARGFESDEDLHKQLAPSEELLNRVRGFTPQGVSWNWSVEASDTGIHRVVVVVDDTLPESLRETRRVLVHHEDWEDALQALGLLP